MSKQVNNKDSAFGKALRFLSHQPRSTTEIRPYLRKHGYDDDVSEDVIKRLCDLKLVDDEDFVSRWIIERAAYKGLGKIRLRSELIRKGLEKSLIDSKLSELYDDELEYERALDISEKKIDQLEGVEPITAKRRLGQFLTSRGYNNETILEVVNKYFG